HVRIVTTEQPLHFLGYCTRRASAMRVSIHGMAAPVASIRAPASRNHRNRRSSVVLAPRLHVARNIDALPIRPGLGVEVRQERRGTIPNDLANIVAENNSCDSRPRGRIEPGCHQLLECSLGLAAHHDVSSGIEIFLSVVGWLGAA